MPNQNHMKVFTLEEANALIPLLRRALGELRAVRNEILRLRGKVEVLHLIHGEAVLEPTNPDHWEFVAQRRNLRALVRDFNRVVEEINGTGAILKDPEAGLVDFYAEVDGELAFLCWKPDEACITHWHSLNGGFAMRQPLGEDEHSDANE